MKIFLIRHGATETSGKTYAGRTDVPLNVRGRAEAETIAVDLATCPLALILTSPLSRALETTMPLAARHGLDPIKQPLLMEFDFGIYEGQSKQALSLHVRTSHARDPVPGGESLLDVWERAGQVLNTLSDFDILPTSSIAIVGHFWINRLLFGRATGLTFEAACRSRTYRPTTGSFALIDFPASMTIT